MSWFEKRGLWKEGQIYILPNRYGYLFILLFFVILLTGSTYSSNVVYLLAFIHLSFSIVIMGLTQKNLKQIELKLIRIEDSFAGESSLVTIITEDISKTNSYNINFSIPQWKWQSSAINSDVKISKHHLRFSHRGKKIASFIKMSSSFPYGLFIAWKYKKVKLETFTYPARTGSKNLDLLINNRNLGEDFYSHRYYHVGDNYKHIDWKSFARRNELLVKEFKDEKIQPIVFNLSQIKDPNTEKKLEQITTWIDIVSTRDIDFGVDLPTKYIPVSRGELHKKLILRELACYEKTP